MHYTVVYHPECLKDIKGLDFSVRKRLKNAIETRLAVAPEDYGKPLRHAAQGFWSLRVGDWRIIYQIRKDDILVLRIGHRREVYKLFR